MDYKFSSKEALERAIANTEKTIADNECELNRIVQVIKSNLKCLGMLKQQLEQFEEEK